MSPHQQNQEIIRAKFIQTLWISHQIFIESIV